MGPIGRIGRFGPMESRAARGRSTACQGWGGLRTVSLFMPRFYIPPHAWKPDQLALDPGETHHALDVLRMKAGDRATVFNGQGAEATVEIASAEKGKIALKKITAGKTAPVKCALTLGQAIPKGKNM